MAIPFGNASKCRNRWCVPVGLVIAEVHTRVDVHGLALGLGPMTEREVARPVSSSGTMHAIGRPVLAILFSNADAPTEATIRECPTSSSWPAIGAERLDREAGVHPVLFAADVARILW